MLPSVHALRRVAPLPRSNSERNQSATEPSRGCPIPRAARTNGRSSSPFGAPTTAAPTALRVGEGRLIRRAIDVEHLPQRDHRNAVPAAAREVDEHLRVVPPVIPEEHPPHVRHPVREMFDPGELARPAAPEQPIAARSCGQSSPACPTDSRHVRAGLVIGRPAPSGRPSRRTPARYPDQPTGHGQDGAWPASNDDREDSSCAGPEAAPSRRPQRPQPEHTVHIEDHAMGIAGGHREPPPYRGEPPWVWRTRRFSQRPLVPGIGLSGVPQRPTSQQICADHAERPPVRHHPRRASRSGLRRLQRIRPGAHAGTRRRPSGAGSDARPPRSRQQPRSWG